MAEVEQQVNWIYVMIVGGLIFVLLVFIGFRIKGYSDTGYCHAITQDIKTQIRSSNYKENTISYSTLNLNDNIYYDGLSYFCQGTQGTDVSNLIIFSESNISYDQKFHTMATITLPYYKPFFIANANFYLDNSSIYYLDTSLYETVVTKYLLNIFKDDDSKKVIEDHFKSGFPSTNSKLKNEICVLSVGSITNTNCDIKKAITPDISNEPLLTLGQILSSESIFEQNKNKLWDRLKKTTVVIFEKCEKIKEAYSTKDIVCEQKYSNIDSEIGNFIGALSNIDTAFAYDTKAINDLNKNLAIDSCVYLY